MLEQVISNLIIKHACVIVPDFGGFISQRVPATLDYKSGKILPPSKSILFNRQLLASDGLLIGAFAAANQINYEAALQAIKQRVNTWKTELSNGGRVSIDHIGYLYMNNDGQIYFEQDKFTNLLLSSYGLNAITITSNNEVKEETPVIEFIDFNTVQEAELETESVDAKVLEVNFSPKQKLHWTRYVAAAALLPIVFYSFWIPVKTDFLQSGVVSIHDFNPFKTQKLVEFKSTKITQEPDKKLELKDIKQQVENSHAEHVYSYEVDGNNYKSIILDEKNVSTQNAAPEARESNVVEQTLSGKYFLIGNCFSIEENAENFVNDLKSKGLQAQIVDQVNGLYRVAVGSATTTEKLEQVKQEVLAKGISNFWILKKQ